MDRVYRNGRIWDEKSRKNREGVLFQLAGLKTFVIVDLTENPWDLRSNHAFLGLSLSPFCLEGSSGEAMELLWVFLATEWTAAF
jgi:hypothetical protein